MVASTAAFTKTAVAGDAGTYTCIAKNGVATSTPSANFVLTVTRK